jgi:hypothetical protein
MWLIEAALEDSPDINYKERTRWHLHPAVDGTMRIIGGVFSYSTKRDLGAFGTDAGTKVPLALVGHPFLITDAMLAKARRCRR